jgi:uncharacterized membrane protein YczE
MAIGVRRRAVAIATSFVVIGLSAALGVKAGLGVGPWAVVCTGVAHVSGASLGVASMFVTLLLIVSGRLLGGPVGIMTVVACVAVTPFADAAMALLPDVSGAATVAYYALSAITLGMGAALLVGAEAGAGAGEVLMIGVMDRFGMSVTCARILIEGSWLALGWILGGQVGVGTAAWVVVFPYVLRACLRVLQVPIGTVVASARNVDLTSASSM